MACKMRAAVSAIVSMPGWRMQYRDVHIYPLQSICSMRQPSGCVLRSFLSNQQKAQGSLAVFRRWMIVVSQD